MAKLFKIEGVEIFAAGVWNKDKYTVKDLDSMVSAFEETSANIKPYLKLGHSSDQSLLQNDGFPAAGWIGKLYRNGEKLLADFIDIPSKIFELLSNKAYRKVSSEIYWDISVNGKKYPKLLSAVALLGSDMPAVTSLDDILSLYGLNIDASAVRVYNDNIESKKIYNYIDDNGGQTMEKEYTKEDLDAKIAELEAKKTSEIEAAKTETESLKAEYSQKEAEIAELKEYKEKAEAEKLELQVAKEKAENEKFIAENEIPASAHEFAMALLGDEKKEYSFGEEKLSKRDLLKKYTEVIKQTADVNFDENSLDGAKPDAEGDEEKINKYMEANSCNYSTAYKAVKSSDSEDELDEDQGE